ncbi:hypothetical protein D3C80_711460 [compost metagenome]
MTLGASSDVNQPRKADTTRPTSSQDLKNSVKPFFGGNQQFMLVRNAVLKQSDQQHRQLIWMSVVFGYHLSEDALKHCQIGGPENNIGW